MTVQLRISQPRSPFPAEAVRQLARLHVQCLPGSVLSHLLQQGVEALYRFVVDSRDEAVAVAWDGHGQAVGISVVSFAPATLLRRLATGSSFLPWLLLSAPRLPWAKLMRRSGAAAPAPELMFLFVAPAYRATGAGAALVRAAEQACVTRGSEALHVKTEDRADNRALVFYARLGYESAGKVVQYGQDFVLLRRLLAG